MRRSARREGSPVSVPWPPKREWLFFVVTGLAEGILTALVLATGRILAPSGALGPALAVKIGLAAGCPETVVFFAAEYARQREELLRMERQLNLTGHGRLAASRLGHEAMLEASVAAVLSGACAFAGACAPLLLARLTPTLAWAPLALAIGCLALFGYALGYATRSSRARWAAALTAAGVALAALGAWLEVL